MAETAPLLPNPNPLPPTRRIVPSDHVHRVLPIALSASVAMAATAATTIYAYAVITCADPANCQGDEQGAYAGAVAVAAGIANVCGIVILGPLQGAVRSNPKFGLFFWLVSRAMSVAVLAVAVLYRSIYIAFAGRVFEGFATDVLLHYNLGAVYVSVDDQRRRSRLMGTSLALFMVGMSLSPAIVGLLPGFFLSFVVALSVFAASVFYLAFFVPVVEAVAGKPDNTSDEHNAHSKVTKSRLLSTFQPLVYLWDDSNVALHGLALLLYNTTQAYLFPSLLVFSSLKYSFTGRENGYLISLGATVSALYLLSIFFIVPFLKRRISKTAPQADGNPDTHTGGSRHDLICAVLSMTTQLAALPCVALTTEGWQLFPLLVPISLGLAASSFIKSYGVAVARDESAAVASLAMMESIGALLSAGVLGTIQARVGVEVVFSVASGLLGAAIVALGMGEVVRVMRS